MFPILLRNDRIISILRDNRYEHHYLVIYIWAYDFSKLRPATKGFPGNPRYTASQWQQIFANQKLKPEVYPGYKKGTIPPPANAGLAVHHDTRVVGGQVATHGQFPWQVLISMDNSYICGGSIISDTWILTAGYCASDFSRFVVVLGSQRSDGQDSGSLILLTMDKTVHEQYDPYRFENDISLLHFTSPICFTQYIQPVRLPTYSMASNTLVGETVTVSGWGKPSDDSSGISEELRYVSMLVMTNQECREYYGNDISESKMCTDTSGGKSSCDGDTGGPLVLLKSDGRYTEVGIFSFGAAAGCEKGLPAAFTRVTSFLCWLCSTFNTDPKICVLNDLNTNRI